MSGGSLDYVYVRVIEAADNIGSMKNSPVHVAFADHLRLVAKALHDVEWVLSCDYGKGDDADSIRAVLAPGAELAAAVRLAEEVNLMLTNTIERSKEIHGD